MRKIHKGDEVIVITGKDKGRTGKVTSFDTRRNKVIVENINLVKKHVRPNPSVGEPGGIVEREMPLDVSNIAIYNPDTAKADRIGIRIEAGKKVRFYKSNGNTLT